MTQNCPARRRIVLVTGLSGAGKSSILRALEDLGYEAVDNPPLLLIQDLVARGDRWLAIGVDARTRDFNAEAALAIVAQLRSDPRLRPELVYAWADEASLLRRFTQTRRRHPLAPQGRVIDGIAAEERLTAPLRQAADLVVDSSEFAPCRPAPGHRAALRHRAERRRAGGVADLVCLSRRAAARGRPGARRPVPAQPPLRRGIAAPHRARSRRWAPI